MNKGSMIEAMQTKGNGVFRRLTDKHIGAAVIILVGIVMIGGIELSGILVNKASADITAVATATVSVSSACSMTGSVSSNHNAALASGTYSGTYNNGSGVPYANGIGSTTITAMCNDNGGYAIYAVGYTNNIIGATNMVGISSGATIATGTAASGSVSNWAMKLAKVTDPDESYNPDNLTILDGFDDYHAVPNAYTKVASYSSNTDAAKGSKLTTTYATYISPTQAADTYVGKVKYTLVHPSTNDNLTNSFFVYFDANGGTGTMEPQIIVRGVTTALEVNSFSSPVGKGFAGWNTTVDGTGTSYANGQQVTDLADVGEGITLYAQWMEVHTIADAGTMQNVSSKSLGGCPDAIPTGQAYTLTDSRDGTEYLVARALDGECWMIQNLKLGKTTTSLVLDSAESNTDANGFTLDGKLSDGMFIDTTITHDGTNYQYTDSKYYCTDDYGCYYSWYTATTTANSWGIAAIAENVNYSICPKGWTMPTDEQFKTLYSYYNSVALMLVDDPTTTTENFSGKVPGFLLGGRYNSSGAFDVGSHGAYWSRTSSNITNSNGIAPDNDHVYFINSPKSFGLSVRCVLQ